TMDTSWRYMTFRDAGNRGSAPGFPRGASGEVGSDRSRLGDRADVGGLLALRPVHDVELHGLALGKGAVSVTGDGGEVNEHVVPVGSCDEPVTLLVAEPLHGPLRCQAVPPCTSGARACASLLSFPGGDARGA